MILRFVFLVLLSKGSWGQSGSNNILLLKKGNKTLTKFMTGSAIRFSTTEGMPVEGRIERITPDSIFLINYTIRRLQRTDGGIIFDTAGRYRLMFSLTNIGALPAGKQKGENILTNGALLRIAGAGYLVLNIINTTRQGDPPFGQENISEILIGAGMVASGYLLGKLWRKRYPIGRKFYFKVIET